MDQPTPDCSDDAALKARVVAWHNRHLLTCRIDATQVTGIGVVALPFAPAADLLTAPPVHAGASPRARIAALLDWLRKQRRLQATPLFSDNFLPPLTPRQIGRFARRFGEPSRPGDPGSPLRTIRTSSRHVPHQHRFLRTAAIEAGGRRLRVLIGSAADPAIIGPRLWDRKRLSGVVGCCSLLVILGSLSSIYQTSAAFDGGMHLATVAADQEPVAAPSPLAAAAVEPAASTSAREPPGIVAAEPRAANAAPATWPEQPPLVPAPPPDEGRAVAAASSAALNPDRMAQADQNGPIAAASAPAQRPPPAPDVQAPAAAAATVADAAPDAQAADASAPLFALAAEPTRSRVSSALRLSLLGFPIEPQKNGAHAELMQAGPLWRVVIWPYANQQSAEQAQDVLRRRGVKVELITF